MQAKYSLAAGADQGEGDPAHPDWLRIGHLVFFDLDMVRATLAARNLVRHRMAS